MQNAMRMQIIFKVIKHEWDMQNMENAMQQYELDIKDDYAKHET